MSVATFPKGVFVIAAKRTPFGAFGGSLKDLSATQLGVVATQSALTSTGIDPSLIDDAYFGNVIPSSSDAAYLARHVTLKAGCRIATPALTLNRLCGSGFESIALASKAINAGYSNVVLAGGTENMSQAPLQVDGTLARWGVPLGKGLQLHDALWDGLTDAHANSPMGMTAEKLGAQYNITRSDCDEYALSSQQRWKAANDAGIFDAELAPVDVVVKKKPHTVSRDEHPRDSTLDKLASLPPVFQKDGLVTAANASGICDGAGCLVVASESSIAQHSWTPLVRIVATAAIGCDPTIMGIGPVPAIQAAVKAVGWKSDLSDVGRLEINEAFAAQVLACAKALDYDPSNLNVHGGAISLGHPLGASGSRIAAHLSHSFARDPTLQRAIGAACIGGGQGIAVLLERV